MKKIIKALAILVGIIVLLLIAGFSYIQIIGIPTFETQANNISVNPTPEKVARGKKLALLLCANCHLNPETNRLTGKQMMDAPPEFGKVYSQNITQSREYGIGSWTDSEIAYLLRTGINKAGRYTPPYMAKLPHMADEDIESVIAFLRSDERLVEATDVADKQCEPSFLTKFLSNVVLSPLPLPTDPIPMPDTANLVVFGKYLAINLECFTCHSADFKTINFMEPEKTPGFFGGGNQPLNLGGKVMPTSNITPHPEAGIGNWSKERFIKAVRFGIMEGEDALRYPMIPYTHLTDYEAESIFEYLKTVTPLNNPVQRGEFN